MTVDEVVAVTGFLRSEFEQAIHKGILSDHAAQNDFVDSLFGIAA